MWDKFVDENIKHYKMNIKGTPIVCKILPIFVPETAPILTTVGGFLKTDSGKELTNMICKGYDSLGEVLKGNFEEAKNELKDGIRLYSTDDLGNIALDTRNFITEVKGIAS
jgi:hypothetical protein